MYELFISDLGSDIHTVWVIKNSTLQTYGKIIYLKKLKKLLIQYLKNHTQIKLKY